MKHPLRLLTLLLVLAALGTWLWWRAQPQPIAVSVATVERGRVERTVANTRAGTVEACRRAGLSPSLGGQIARLPVQEGQKVKQGQLLLELWNDDLRAQLDLARQEAEAARATARARCIEAGQAEREARRLRTLRQRKLISEEKADQADAKARAARAACEAASAQASVARSRIGVAEAQLAKTRLTAPFDGVVAQINGELSEYVTPSPVGVATPPAVDLVDDGCFYVSAPIDEVDVAGVTVGQTARLTLDAFGDRRFAGRVRRVADFVQDREKQARTVEVEVAFTDPADIPDLLAGYSADVEIILAVRRDTLRIPSEALLEGQQVYVLGEDGRLHRRRVKTGVANWDFTEILDGLTAGERVVTSVDREGLGDGVTAEAREAPEP
ncbi:MAG TPA: efflux RND transporter periplasmic adaptor subunit [Gammaproteobacteria bacterium]|nr:efflux RND transporter periplasmic adaptor subunit [Gammaproteobacteria bacterium]